MKFSTKARYGLRAMIELALRNEEDPVSVKSIAECQGISEAYLEQLMAILSRRGLVRSIRGAQGGYLLARDPSTIRVGDVIRALDGPLVPVECVSRENPVNCKRYDYCPTRPVWERVRDVLEESLDSLTLQDLRNQMLAAGKEEPEDIDPKG